MATLPPPPINDKPGSFTWLEWYRQLRNYVSTTGSVPWYIINFAGSNITDIAARSHQNLQSLQGGSAGERYHLTASDYSGIINKSFSTLKVGDATNYTNIETDGTIEFFGDATVWEDLRIEPTIKASGSNDPTLTKWFDNGSGSRGVFLFDFDDAVTASQKEVSFQVQLPHAWKGTTIHPHVHWIPSAAGTSQRPVWGLEYNWTNVGQTFGNTSIAYTTALVPNDTNLTQYGHYVSTFAGITPTSSQDDISAVLCCRLFRRSGDASDTYTGTCGLLYVDFHYEINTIGSRSEFTK
jgi:hypothetical protein